MARSSSDDERSRSRSKSKRKRRRQRSSSSDSSSLSSSSSGSNSRSRSKQSRKKEERRRKKSKSSKQSKKRQRSSSSSSSSSSPSEYKSKKKQKKDKKMKEKHKHKKEKKKKKKKKKNKQKRKSTDSLPPKAEPSFTFRAEAPFPSGIDEVRQPQKIEMPAKEEPQEALVSVGPSPRVLKPITKEEWEKQQSVMRHVYDEESGRTRLIKGDGEVIEEIVSKGRHHEINKMSTQGDGKFFATKMGLL